MNEQNASGFCTLANFSGSLLKSQGLQLSFCLSLLLPRGWSRGGAVFVGILMSFYGLLVLSTLFPTFFDVMQL